MFKTVMQDGMQYNLKLSAITHKVSIWWKRYVVNFLCDTSVEIKRK